MATACARESCASTVMILPLTRMMSGLGGDETCAEPMEPANSATRPPRATTRSKGWRTGGILAKGDSGFAAFISFRQHAGMPLIVFRMDIAEPLIALRAVHGCCKIARFIRRGDSLTDAVRASFLLF